jgi:hypothetical protein
VGFNDDTTPLDKQLLTFLLPPTHEATEDHGALPFVLRFIIVRTNTPHRCCSIIVSISFQIFHLRYLAFPIWNQFCTQPYTSLVESVKVVVRASNRVSYSAGYGAASAPPIFSFILAKREWWNDRPSYLAQTFPNLARTWFPAFCTLLFTFLLLNFPLADSG